MADFKINNVEPNAHKSWMKEALELLKRNVFFSLMALCVCFLAYQLPPLQYSFSLALVCVLSIFSVLLGLKSDNSISFFETLKGFSFEESGFFKCLYSAWRFELVFSIFSFFILLPIHFLNIEKLDETVNINFFDIFIAIFLSLTWVGTSFISHFHFQFNLFFSNLDSSEFKGLFLQDILKNEKPCLFIFLADFILGCFLFITMFTIPFSQEKSIALTIITAGLFFMKVVQFVAFREFFLGRGKNKEVKESLEVDVSQLTPIPIRDK